MANFDYFDTQFGGGQKGQSTEDLQNQIKSLTERLDALSKPAKPPRQYAIPQAPEAPQEVPVNMKGLPDPLTDGEAYGAELVRRYQEADRANEQLRENYQKQVVEYEAAQRRVVDGLWDGFKEEYPDFAGVDAEKIEFAGTKAIEAAKAKGTDITKYAFENPAAFYADIQNELKKVLPADFGKKKDPDEEFSGDPLAAARAEALRTVGIPGGGSFGKPSSGPTNPSAGDMLSDLSEMQQQSGFY